MKETCLPLGALLLLSWTLLVTMEPQHQESGEAVVEVPGGEGLHTSFSCRGRIQGYYADIETGCRLYHLCDETGRQFTNACPNLTLFQQRMMICDHWYMVNCSASVVDYAANLLLGRRDQPFLKTQDQQQQKRVSLPVTFPHDDDQDDTVKTEETSTARQPTREYPVKTSSASSKRKSPVNSGKTVSFSISSLSAASQEDYYRRNQPRTKSQRRPVQGSRVALNQDSVPARFTTSESTTVSVPSSASYNFSNAYGAGRNQGIDNRYRPEGTRTETYPSQLNQNSYQVQKTYESSSLRTQSNFGASDVTMDHSSDQVQNINGGTKQFVTSSPRTVSNSDSSTIKSSYSGGQYFYRTNSPELTSTTSSNLPYKYANNPFLQNYFKSSSPVHYTTTTVPSVFNIDVGEDEDDHSGNRIEIILQDPRRMFFIPDSDFDLNSVLDAKNSTVLVIPVPHHHGAMRFRSYDRLIEGRNPQCPRCHPAFLLPGQCQPCVLIK